MGTDGDRCAIPGLRDESVRRLVIVQMLIRQDGQPRIEDIRETAGKHHVDRQNHSSLEHFSSALAVANRDAIVAPVSGRPVSRPILIFRLGRAACRFRLYGCG